MAESEEELMSLLKVKEKNEKAGLKLNIQKSKITASGYLGHEVIFCMVLLCILATSS